MGGGGKSQNLLYYFQMDDLVSKLSGSKKMGSNVWCDFAGESESGLVWYRKISDNQCQFHGYDEVGNISGGGMLTVTSENGKVAFTLESSGKVKRVWEGWLAVGKEGASWVEIFIAKNLLENHGDELSKVLKAFFRLKNKEVNLKKWKERVESVGVGLSGEEEVRVVLEVK